MSGNTTRYRLQLQHMAYEKKRRDRRRQESLANLDVMAYEGTPRNQNSGNGVKVKIHQIGTQDEGVLYTHTITVSSLLGLVSTWGSSIQCAGILSLL